MDDASHPPDTLPSDAVPDPGPFGPPCPGCGRPRTEADVYNVAWSSQHTPDGTVSFVCPDCTRAEIAQIETGLASSPARRRSPAA
jgi:hypothetical protein